jgi:hypothetical protein
MLRVNLLRSSVCLVLSLIAAMILAACSSVSPNTSSSGTLIDVYLIPMDDFSVREVNLVREFLSRDLGLNVRVTGHMGSADLKTIPGTKQLAVEDVLDAARRVTPKLPQTHAKTAYVVITSRDLNMKNSQFEGGGIIHVGVKNIRMGVVSTARVIGSENGQRAPLDTIRNRLIKLVKREIGTVYYGYATSTDLSDIMYSPIMRGSDVDRLGWDYQYKTNVMTR